MWSLELKIKTKKRIDSAIDLSEAFEKAFDYQLDKLIIRINDKVVSLSLAYTFSDLLPDFLLIINDLLDSEKGEGIYGFSQNDVFDADWDIKWDNSKLTILIIWRVLLNNNIISPTKLIINKNEFIESWKKIFIFLSEFIDFRSISLEYDDEKKVINKLLDKK